MKKVNIKKTRNQKPKDDQSLDAVLRPFSWNDYIGQKRIKKGLKIILEAANKRNEPFDHLLFYGQPGLGKTTLAHLIAAESKSNLRVVSGPSLSRIGDLAAILPNLEEKDILFIDEAHRVPRPVEELFYSAIDERKIHLTLGKGPSARAISLDLPYFTLICATTRVNLISPPLRSRFGAIFRFDYYEKQDIEAIVERSAKILGFEIASEAVSAIARASRFTPRLANRLLKRSRDFAEMRNLKIIDKEIVSETFKILEIDEMGLESYDRHLLKMIIEKFGGGPVGVNALTAALGEEKGVIEEVYEPYLIKIGFLQRTPIGRMATEETYKWLNIAR